MTESLTTLCAPFPPLAQRIEQEAVVVHDRIIKIDHFLNHRIEPDLMQSIGTEMAARLEPFQPNLILTAEASGIPPALATAFACRTPLVYAKKYDPDVPIPALMRRVPSPTKGRETQLAITARFIPAGSRVAIVDDFLANGRTALALAEMAQEAGAVVVAAAFVVEKVFQRGRDPLLALGIPVIALAQIERFTGGRPVIAGWSRASKVS
ncbi:phosphoribosyltransferase family protein [Chloroflexus sp.]|uniref:phosphoribosyltransferase family protein n=1 Tax=Chloroflexus sp. TaxID=1904827 RepID=UPI00298EF19B|nr:phosphoribosyltransferase family protein [Chloroflexus sp.]MCS6889708.1 phosphoribosyltransferase family protein [Chloroflexus sp.]MDW8405220.1 phosphoribosyltransferase family protein [Chloroflexus sp.]